METFEQVWESSRTNSLSWMYPATILSCVATIIALNMVRHRRCRRIATAVVIGIGTVLAINSAALEIQEKWRIRREWADLNPTLMTESGYTALTIDGANLTLGPVLYGLGGLVCFLAAVLILWTIRVAIEKRSP